MNFNFNINTPLGVEIGKTSIENRKEFHEAARAVAGVTAARQLADHLEGDADAATILLSRFGFDAKLVAIVTADLTEARAQFLEAGEVDEVERIDAALTTVQAAPAPRRLVLSGPKALESIATCDDLNALEAALDSAVTKKSKAALIDALQARIDTLLPERAPTPAPAPAEETPKPAKAKRKAPPAAPTLAPNPTAEEAPPKGKAKRKALAPEPPPPAEEPPEPAVVPTPAPVPAPVVHPTLADGTIDKYSGIVEHTCPRCREAKQRECFGFRRMGKVLAIQPWCKVCRNVASRQTRVSKRDKAAT